MMLEYNYGILHNDACEISTDKFLHCLTLSVLQLTVSYPNCCTAVEMAAHTLLSSMSFATLHMALHACCCAFEVSSL